MSLPKNSVIGPWLLLDCGFKRKKKKEDKWACGGIKSMIRACNIKSLISHSAEDLILICSVMPSQTAPRGFKILSLFPQTKLRSIF